jgi:DNA adenine methylase
MDINPMRRVAPVRPAAGYIGGKKQLAAALVARIEAASHATYAEPFVGMGGVFLRRRFAPPSEVINDLSGDVATFFRILQRHYAAFMDMLKFQLTGREAFERLRTTDPATLTDLERAARFLYLQRATFGGKVAGRSFGVSPGSPGRFDVTKLAEILTALNGRLAGVVIENLPYGEFIARYDRPETLFYLDPPYFGTEDFYGADAFSRNGMRETCSDAADGAQRGWIPWTFSITGAWFVHRPTLSFSVCSGNRFRLKSPSMTPDTPASYSFVKMRIARRRCSRRGGYSLARLAAKYGAEIEMMDLLAYLAGDCAIWERRQALQSRCGAFFIDLGLPPRPPDLPTEGQRRLKVIKGDKNAA